MKCSECGYVSFDELTECKRCGAGVAGGETAEPSPVSELQKDLFSLRLEEEETGFPQWDEKEPPKEGFETEDGGNEGMRLPEMNIDFDPAAADEDEDALQGYADSPEPSTEVSQETVIDDDTDLPDDLWVEESAGFMIRLGAFAIDGLALAALLGIFAAGALLALGPGEYGLAVFGSPGVIIAFYLLGLLASLGYFTFFLGWIGRTPGKALLRLDVRRSDGAPMSYARAFLRWAGYLVSLTFAGLGFLWIFFDERKRGWHDYLSGTWVKDLRHEA